MNNKILDVLKNRNLMRIAKNASNKFKNTLTEEEMRSCTVNAIWRALQSHRDKPGGSKFSSYLYNGVQMECRSFIKSNITQRPILKHNRVNNPYKTLEMVDMLDEISTCEDPDLIYDRYYNNMTIKELANERKISKESIRLKIKKNLKILKDKLS